MATYGGMGGVSGGRQLDPADLFEAAVERALGARIREDEGVAADMWSALANVDWVHEDASTAAYSFRAAGDLVAALRGSGDYINWYCCGPTATVSDAVSEALAAEGWRPEAIDGKPLSAAAGEPQ